MLALSVEKEWALKPIAAAIGFLTTNLFATALTGKLHLLLRIDPRISLILGHPRMAAAVLLMVLSCVVICFYSTHLQLR